MNQPPIVNQQLVEKYRPLLNELRSRILREPGMCLNHLTQIIGVIPLELLRDLSDIEFVGFLVEAPVEEPTPQPPVQPEPSPQTPPEAEGSDTGESKTE